MCAELTLALDVALANLLLTFRYASACFGLCSERFDLGSRRAPDLSCRFCDEAQLGSLHGRGSRAVLDASQVRGVDFATLAPFTRLDERLRTQEAANRLRPKEKPFLTS